MRIYLVFFTVVLLAAQAGWDFGTGTFRFHVEEVIIYWENSTSKVHKSKRLRKVFLTGSKITLQGTGLFIIEDMEGTQIRITLRNGRIYEIP